MKEIKILRPRLRASKIKIKISKVDISKDLERMIKANKKLLVELSK